MSGFLVVADDQPLRPDVPTIHLKDFEAIVTQTGIYESLFRPQPLVPPFGFIYAPRLEHGVTSPSQFVVPATEVEHRDTAAWHFKIEPLQSGSHQWFRATETKPLENLTEVGR